MFVQVWNEIRMSPSVLALAAPTKVSLATFLRPRLSRAVMRRMIGEDWLAGTSPLKDKSASTGNAMVSMTVTMLAVIVPQLPALGLGIWGAASGNLLLQLGAGLLALVVGVVEFGLGLRIGCARLDARYPDLFQKVRAFL